MEENERLDYIYCLSDINNNIFAKIQFIDKKIQLQLINDNGYHKYFKNSIITVDCDVYLENLTEVLKEYDISISNNFTFVFNHKQVSSIAENKEAFHLIYDIFELQRIMLKYLNTFEDKQYDLLFYNNVLSTHMMVKNILGDSYYNEGMDTYIVNQYIARDICAKFYYLNVSLSIWRGICAIAFAAFIAILLIR